MKKESIKEFPRKIYLGLLNRKWLLVTLTVAITFAVFGLSQVFYSRKEAQMLANDYLEDYRDKGYIQYALTDEPNKIKPKLAEYTTDHLKVDWNEIALKSARVYIQQAKFSSKQLLFDDYRYDFSREQAQYVVDHLDVDWNDVAIEIAKNYPWVNYSKKKLFRRLTDVDIKFTEEEAQYALDHLDRDWNEVALEQARVLKSRECSKDVIKKRLVSNEFEFTEDEAQYAINHLPEE